MKKAIFKILNALSAKKLKGGNYEIDKKCEEITLTLLRSLRFSSERLVQMVSIDKVDKKDAYVIHWKEVTISGSIELVYEDLPQRWGEPTSGWVEHDYTERNTTSEGTITLYFRKKI